jgi:validoxylamine A glucosyltransferase
MDAGMIGAVVPVHNRRTNVELLLASLARQTIDDFQVIIADDGSTDGTRELVERETRHGQWNGRLRWIGCGPNLGVRTGRARNIGAANLDAGIRLLLMLDSDLVLRPEAMALFAEAHARRPNTVLFGQVDWLPPLDAVDILAAVDGGHLDGLRALVPPARERVEGTFTGPELREDLFGRADTGPFPLNPGWALPLNSGWPPDIYWEAGGFDETMTGYGYQDMNLGARASRVGASCLACPDLWALHVWHPKPSKSMLENQRNLDRYLREHGAYLRDAGFGDLLEVDVDWTLWWHYHADRGGTIARWQGRAWAVSADGRHRLALPDATWHSRLGSCRHDAGDGAERDVSQSVDHGIARD